MTNPLFSLDNPPASGSISPLRCLFLGDSITACARFKSKDNLGFGYVHLIGKALADGRHVCINRGIDGFTLHRVCGLWENQCPPLLPVDHISVLVGINDIAMWTDCGLSAARQQRRLEEYIEEYEDLLVSLTGTSATSFCIMEPFLFPHPAYLKAWMPLLDEMRMRIQDMAHTFHLPFLPLHERLNTAAKQLGYGRITTDGVHLTREGHQIIAKAWLDAAGIVQP